MGCDSRPQLCHYAQQHRILPCPLLSHKPTGGTKREEDCPLTFRYTIVRYIPCGMLPLSGIRGMCNTVYPCPPSGIRY